MERFASVAAHDMKEPLRMIQQFMTLIKARYGSTFDEKALKYIDVAIEGARRMTQLIQDLLTYAKLDDKSIPFDRISLESVHLSSIALLEPVIEEAEAKITWDELPEIVGQPTALRLLFQNLINNALKYRDSQRPLYIHVSSKQAESGWEISVRDNGIGIPNEYHSSIFDMFTRINPKGEGTGTGMGLATCRKIALTHNGDIRVESETGVGSTFVICLPTFYS